ncbi:MAG: hypothetical protein SWY16_00080 [Cyanobacteriota bacterium]|nr:hypothetical protein [Cyanobacteriota bacterium]
MKITEAGKYTMFGTQKLSTAIASSILVVLSCTGASRAATVTASTTGYDTGGDTVLGFNSFFQVAFNAGDPNVHITSFTFDLSPDIDGFFDPNGVTFLGEFLGGGTPTLGGTNGIAPNNIKFETLNGGKQLRGNLLANDFTVGRSLTFGVDTDNVGINEIPIPVTLGLQSGEVNIDTGADFGRVGALLNVTLSDGTSGSAPFVVTRDVSLDAIIDGANANPPAFPEPAPQSVATVVINDEVRDVPEPTFGVSLILAALGLGAKVKRNRKS